MKTTTLNTLPESLEYFTEWGARSWTNLLEKGLSELGEDLEGRRVLEIGCRRGRMTSLFALLGATVTGADLSTEHMAEARAEAERWGVQDRVTIQQCSPMLEEFAPGSFDLVFTKSVLVMVQPLATYLARIRELLAPGGRVLFIENGTGSLPIRIARKIRHRNWRGWEECEFFDRRKCDVVRDAFEDVRIDHSAIPPVYLFQGSRPVGTDTDDARPPS